VLDGGKGSGVNWNFGVMGVMCGVHGAFYFENNLSIVGMLGFPCGLGGAGFYFHKTLSINEVVC
jgi:hypothetical protein